jgi:aminopeptidase N
MSHSVRPDSYIEISNFYTVTIYEKGAEVVRMISNIIGPEYFRKGSDLYFNRHDGEAVTTEEFVKAMEDASDTDLSQFRLWYSQAGTPKISIKSSYNENEETFTLAIEQSCPATPMQKIKKPFYIPLRIGLLDREGNALSLVTDSTTLKNGSSTDQIFPITESEQKIVFREIKSEPIPSLLRSFSAPVQLDYSYRREELYFLMVHDEDEFNRWNASQLLAIDVIDELQMANNGSELKIPEIFSQAYIGVLKHALTERSVDKAMVAHLLTLPSESFLLEQSEIADIELIHSVRERILNYLSKDLFGLFEEIYRQNEALVDYAADAESIARRSLKNMALNYLVRSGKEEWLDKCIYQFEKANNMTDQIAALRALILCGGGGVGIKKEEILSSFYSQWQHEPLVVDQWFVSQAIDPSPNTLQNVEGLMKHEAFDIKNPNKVRSLIGTFCSQNHICFHARNGDGYEFLADRVIELDGINPQIASRLLTPLTRWKKFDNYRQRLIQSQLQRIKISPNLSKDVFEVVQKSTIS